MATQYVAAIHNICTDPNLPNEMTPLQYLKGVTPDISAYLQFTFWQPILYLDHEAEWPSSRERSGRWNGIAKSIGDVLTFWILDDQSKHILSRSVVRPFTENLRVKWDPAVTDISDVDLDVITVDYTNNGMDTSQPEVPCEGPITRAKGKLILDNDKLNLDESIDQHPRKRKQPYKEVRYKNKYIPLVYRDPITYPVTNSRCSERLKKPLLTTWKASRTRKAMTVNGRSIIVPSSIQAIPSKGLNHRPLSLRQPTPLILSLEHEELRAYHARLYLMQALINPEQADLEWQAETITEWTAKGVPENLQVLVKVTWIGGDKQWVSLDDMRLHDPYMVIRYAFINKLTGKPGWDWTKHYLDSDKAFTNMVYAYKASRFLRNIKFGVEVPQSTRHAI